MKWAANTAEIYKKQKEPAKNQTLAQKKQKQLWEQNAKTAIGGKAAPSLRASEQK